MKAVDISASPMAEYMTSGATAPATMPLAVDPTTACSDDAMPRRSGCRSSTSSVTTGTISAQPKANTAIGHSDHHALGASSALATMLSADTPSMMRKPCRIWFLGRTLPAMRPDSHEPVMMPAMLRMKNQKNCVGLSCRMSPRKAGADST